MPSGSTTGIIGHFSNTVHGCARPSPTQSPTSSGVLPGSVRSHACWSDSAVTAIPDAGRTCPSEAERTTCTTGSPRSYDTSRLPAFRNASPGAGRDTTCAHSRNAGSRAPSCGTRLKGVSRS